MRIRWLPLALWCGPTLGAGGSLDVRGLWSEFELPESQENVMFAALPEEEGSVSSAPALREFDDDDEDDVPHSDQPEDDGSPRFALYLRVTVFGELGSERGSEEAWQAATHRAEKLVFTTLVRSLFVGATGHKTNFKIQEKPIIQSYVTPPYQLDDRRPGGKNNDQRSPFLRSHFEFIFNGLHSTMADAVSRSICRDYEREEQEMVNSVLRALDASNAYPSDMISTAARLLTGMSSVIHFMAGTIDTGLDGDCPRGGHLFKNDYAQGCFIEGGCYWEEQPMAPKPDEERQMFAFHLPPCPENSELDETGKTCKCDEGGWEGVFQLVTHDGDQSTRPTFQSVDSKTKCERVYGWCEVSLAGTPRSGRGRPQMMVLNDGSPAQGYVDERANVECAIGYTPSGQATCGRDRQWSPEPTCTFLPAVAPPEPVCSIEPLQGPNFGYNTDGCEDCQGTSGEPWEEKCSCNVRCKEGFKSTGEVEEGNKMCKAKKFDCPGNVVWNSEKKCVDSTGDQINSWCCEEAWGSTLPPEKLTSENSCVSLKDHRSCLLAQDMSDGAPCCWRHEGFGGENGTKCVPMSSDKLLSKHAAFNPTGGCAVDRSVLTASWEPLPTCTPKCDPILPADGLLPTDCDDCVPGDCNCRVRCADGFVRFGGGPEHEVRGCQGAPSMQHPGPHDYSMTPAVPACFQPIGTRDGGGTSGGGTGGSDAGGGGHGGLFTDPRRGMCKRQRDSDRFRVVWGCKSCKAEDEDCYCKAECPERTKWVGGGEQNTRLRCITKRGPEVKVTIVAACEEIYRAEQCTNSSVMEDGKEIPCCYRKSGFSDDNTITCARQGNPLITQERRPQVCTERVESHWEPLPECRLLCDQGPLASAPHVTVSEECGDCIVNQEDCKCKVTCAPGYVRVGGGAVVGTRSCGQDLSYGDAPVCRQALPGEMTGNAEDGGGSGGDSGGDSGGHSGGGSGGDSGGHSSHIPKGVVPPICPVPQVEAMTVEGCEECAAGDHDCVCEMRCYYYYSDMEDPERELPQICQPDGESELHAGKSCTGIESEEECLSSRDRELNTTCCWRSGGHAEDGKARCAPFGWKDMRYAPDSCAHVLKASFRPPKCDPLCIQPWAEELEEKHVEIEGCERCVAGQECPECKLTCEGDHVVLAGRSGRTSCETSDRYFQLPTCVCPPDKAESCAKEQLRCEKLSPLFKSRYGRVKGCGDCDPGDECECEITCKETDKLIGDNSPKCEKVPLTLASKKACKDITDEDECLASKEEGTENDYCCFQESGSGDQCVASSKAEGQVRCAVGLMGKWTNLPVCKRKCINVFAHRPDLKAENCDDCAADAECRCNVTCAEGWEHYGGEQGPKKCSGRGAFDSAPVCGRPEAPPECPSPEASLEVSPAWAIFKTNVECVDYTRVRTSETLAGCKKACENYGVLAFWEEGRCDCCRSDRMSQPQAGARLPSTDVYVKGPLQSNGCSGCTAGGDCPSCSVSCAKNFALVTQESLHGGHPQCIAADIGRGAAICENAKVKTDCLTMEQDGQPCCWEGTKCLRKGSSIISSMANLQCAPMKVARWTGLPECTAVCYNDFHEADHVIATNCDKCIPGDEHCPCRVACEEDFAMIGQQISERSCSVDSPKMNPAPVCIKEEPLKCPSPDLRKDNWIDKWRGVSWRQGLQMAGCDCTPDQAEPCECDMTCTPGYKLVNGSEGEKRCVIREAQDFLQERQCSKIASQEDCLQSAWKGEQCCWWPGKLWGGKCGLTSDNIVERFFTLRGGNPWKCTPLRMAEWEDLPVCHHKCDPAALDLGSRLKAVGCDNCTAGQKDCPCYITCKDGLGDRNGDAGVLRRMTCIGDDLKAEWANNYDLHLLWSSCKSECSPLDSQRGTIDLAQCPKTNILMEGEKCMVRCRRENNIQRVGGAPEGSWVQCGRSRLPPYDLDVPQAQFPVCAPICERPDDQYGKLDVRLCSARCTGNQQCNCDVRCKGAKSGGGATGKKRCKLFPGNDTVDASAAWVDANLEMEDRVSFTLSVDVDSETGKRRSEEQWESVVRLAISDALGYNVMPSDVEVGISWLGSKLQVGAKVYSGASGQQVKAIVDGGGLKDAVAAALGMPETSGMTGFGVANVKLLPAAQGWNQLPQCLPPITIEVVSAQTNKAVYGAEISIYPDEARTPGTETLTAKTAMNGRVSLATEGRFYTVTFPKYAAASGFFDRSTCGASQSSCSFKVAISPEMPGQEIDLQDCTFVGKAPNNPQFMLRAVLTWDKRPADLDIWARSLDCARDIWDKYSCNPGSSRCQYLFTSPKVLRRHDRCIVRSGGSKKASKTTNQLPQWAHWYNKRVDTLNRDERRPWVESNYIKLDVDERNGFGPETVTFGNLPPGTYQIVVDTFTNGYADIRVGRPVVTLYLGRSSIPFKCTISPSCTAASRVWNVVNIVIEEVSRNSTSETYRVRLKDSRANMEKLHLLDVVTSSSFQLRHGYSDRYLQNVCFGACAPADGRAGGGRGSTSSGCVDHGAA